MKLHNKEKKESEHQTGEEEHATLELNSFRLQD